VPSVSARGNRAGSSSLKDQFKRYLEGSGRVASLFAGAVHGALIGVSIRFIGRRAKEMDITGAPEK
jgi:hypothetical protein